MPTVDLLADPENTALTWFNPPARWRWEPGALSLVPDHPTDFWQGTHYGFRVDSGHLLHTEATGDLTLEATVVTEPLHQYDQAGLMVRISPECWLKSCLEYEPSGPSWLGAVVTNAGWSDWSTQAVAAPAGPLGLRITRTGADYLVEADPGGTGTGWTRLRIARLHADAPGTPVACGAFACSPRGSGMRVRFTALRLTTG